jgi:S1-C subfamily serine protease
MVQAIVTTSGGHEGISLIYPTKNIIDSIARINRASDRTARYNFIGIQSECIDPTPERPDTYGSRVVDVIPGSPAWQAGIRKNDVIMMLNLSLVDCKTDVYSIVTASSPGSVVVGVLSRGDRRESFTLTIDEVTGF